MQKNRITKQNDRRLLTAFIILLILVVPNLYIYQDVGSFSFTGYDDPLYVLENHHISEGFSPESIRWAFTSLHAGNWHPVTWLSHMLDIELYGLDPGGHHWTSVQIHIANTLLLFLVLFRMTNAVWRSAVAALLFAVHPLHVESVAWISERKDVLSTLFGLLTLLFYHAYTKNQTLGSYSLVFLFLVLGLMAKPMLVTWPFVLLLLDFWPLRRFGRRNHREGFFAMNTPTLRKLFLEKIPLVIPVALSCILTLQAQQGAGAVRSMDAVSFAARTTNAADTYVQYLLKTVWPVDLIAFYPHANAFLTGGHIFSVAAVLFAITVTTLFLLKQQPCLFTGWMWYVGTLIPVIGIIQVGSQAMADRYTYIPLIGIFIAVSWGVYSLSNPLGKRTPILSILAIAVIAAFSYQSRIQSSYWKDTATLFEHVLRVSPDNWIAHNNFGAVLMKNGEPEQAILHFQAALSVKPGFVDATLNLALALGYIGDTDGAKKKYMEILNINQKGAVFLELKKTAAMGLAKMLGKEKKYSKAITIYKDLIAANFRDYISHNCLAYIYLLATRYVEAEKHLKIALDIKPDYADAHYNLAQVYLILADNKKAMNHMGEALAIVDQMKTREVDPGYANVFNTFGRLLLEKGNREAAEVFFKKAHEIDPRIAEKDGQWVSTATNPVMNRLLDKTK